MLRYDNVVCSEIAGFISIACWMVVGFPQLYENYKRKSGDSVSLPFVYIWLLGDFFNLLGAILQNLLLTVYRNYDFDEEVSLLQSMRTDSQTSQTSQTSIYQSRVKQSLEILIGLVGVCVAGVIMYYISTLFRNNEKDGKDGQQHMELLPQIFGWCSAMLYLGARIPQIIQNHKSQSTEGLSLAMFCFCVLGNVTFCS
ncbi:2120_t:CDS:2, partial [Cetraspora pellucida]